MSSDGSVYSEDLLKNENGNLIVSEELRSNGPVVSEGAVTTADPTVVLDVEAALLRIATEFNVWNDGSGDITVEISNDGVVYGTPKTMKPAEPYSIEKIVLRKIRINLASGVSSNYRALAL